MTQNKYNPDYAMTFDEWNKSCLEWDRMLASDLGLHDKSELILPIPEDAEEYMIKVTFSG